MAEFKLVISDPKTGKTTQKEIKDQSANAFLNKKIGETVLGEGIDMTGYEFMITGGSDKSGFPMRKGIQSKRKKILIGKGSIGFRGKNRGYTEKGTVKKKTVCGDRVDAGIAQINLKITKQGSAQLFEEKKEVAAEAKAAE
jgi:small subunit ribosomal protein S6e